MRRAGWLAFALMFALASVALGQDAPPPKPKHENVVTPEAKAAIERYARLVYRPGEHGLVTASGTVAPDGVKFEFEAPSIVAVAQPREAFTDGQLSSEYTEPLQLAFKGPPICGESEFDAELVNRDGELVLVVRTDWTEPNRVLREYSLDAQGLFVEMRLQVTIDGKFSSELVSRFEWLRHGERFVLSVLDATVFVDGHRSAFRYELAYADVGGLWLMTSYMLSKQGDSKRYRFESLRVNGKSVELPKPWKHVNRVSAEAKEAIERYAKSVDRPTDRGLVSLAGGIAQDGDATAVPRRFRFAAGGHLAIDPAQGADPKSGRAKMGQFLVGAPLEATLAGLPLVSGDEYDAEFIERDGKRTLTVTNFRDGVKRRSDEFVLDSNGMIATSVTDVGGRGPSVTTKIAWEKAGDLHRIRTLDVTAVVEGGTMRFVYELEYGEIGGFALVKSYRFAASGAMGADAMSKAATFRLVDLVVNGKKTESPSLPAETK